MTELPLPAFQEQKGRGEEVGRKGNRNGMIIDGSMGQCQIHGTCQVRFIFPPAARRESCLVPWTPIRSHFRSHAIRPTSFETFAAIARDEILGHQTIAEN
jgi:hypothetical protein